MKKFLTAALTTGLILALGAGFANTPSASHGVDIRIPNVLFLRITDGDSNASLENTVVNFDFVTEIDAYLDHVTAVSDDAADPWIGSTDDDPAFGDVIVFSNRNNDWHVTVVATDTGFGLSNIRVSPSGDNESDAAEVGSLWTLSTTAEDIFTGGGRTNGWKSLGFSADDYEIRLDGTELPGDYSTVVTYTIVQP